MVNRIALQTPASQMKTYSISKPTETHTRPATCAEVDCGAQAGGWETHVDEATDLGARQAHYMRTQSGRAHTEALVAGVTVFVFPPGEECFAAHRVSLDRPEFYVVRDGDWRSYGAPRAHSGPDSWVNDFGTHQDQLARAINGKA